MFSYIRALQCIFRYFHLSGERPLVFFMFFIMSFHCSGDRPYVFLMFFFSVFLTTVFFIIIRDIGNSFLFKPKEPEASLSSYRLLKLLTFLGTYNIISIHRRDIGSLGIKNSTLAIFKIT